MYLHGQYSIFKFTHRIGQTNGFLYFKLDDSQPWNGEDEGIPCLLYEFVGHQKDKISRFIPQMIFFLYTALKFDSVWVESGIYINSTI